MVRHGTSCRRGLQAAVFVSCILFGWSGGKITNCFNCEWSFAIARAPCPCIYCKLGVIWVCLWSNPWAVFCCFSWSQRLSLSLNLNRAFNMLTDYLFVQISGYRMTKKHLEVVLWGEGREGESLFPGALEWRWLTCLVRDSQDGAVQPDIPLSLPWIMEKHWKSNSMCNLISLIVIYRVWPGSGGASLSPETLVFKMPVSSQ